jgi:hypothetical protein
MIITGAFNKSLVNAFAGTLDVYQAKGRTIARMWPRPVKRITSAIVKAHAAHLPKARRWYRCQIPPILEHWKQQPMPQGMSHADLQARIASNLRACEYTFHTHLPETSWVIGQPAPIACTMTPEAGSIRTTIYVMPGHAGDRQSTTWLFLLRKAALSVAFRYHQGAPAEKGAMIPPRQFRMNWDGWIEATNVSYAGFDSAWTMLIPAGQDYTAICAGVRVDVTKPTLKDRWPLSPPLALSMLPTIPRSPWPPTGVEPANYYSMPLWPAQG